MDIDRSSEAAEAPAVGDREAVLGVPPVAPPVAPVRRPGLIWAAGTLLSIFGLIGVAAGFLLLGADAQGRVAGVATQAAHGVAIVVLALGGLEAVAGILVLLRRPAGRVLGFAFAGIGVLSSVLRLGAAPGSGLVGIAVGGFVIYALGVTGHHFRTSVRR